MVDDGGASLYRYLTKDIVVACHVSNPGETLDLDLPDQMIAVPSAMLSAWGIILEQVTTRVVWKWRGVHFYHCRCISAAGAAGS
jgi:hypothetical protein